MTGDTQTRVASAVEVFLNSASGFVVALITWRVVAAALGIPMPLDTNVLVTAIFTTVSVTRSYLWRRLFASGYALRAWLWLTKRINNAS